MNPSDTDNSEQFGGQYYPIRTEKVAAANFNEEDGNYIVTNGLDIIKSKEIDLFFRIVCEEDNVFFQRHFVMNIIDCPETQSIWLQLTKNRVTTAKTWQLSSLKTIFYPFEFRCSIVSRILKYIDCCTARRVTVDMDLSESCTVCLADYTLGEDIRILPCSHMFHRKCIDQWIVFGCCCPICRLEIQFCNHTQCKEITIDANFSSYFELPPNAPPRGEIPINESKVDGNRLFYSTLADLMQYAENTMNDLTFDDILQEVRSVASQRGDVDVPAMFNAINAHRARELRSKPAAPSSAPNTINITASTHQEPPPHPFPPETWSDDPPLRSYLETQNGLQTSLSDWQLNDPGSLRKRLKSESTIRISPVEVGAIPFEVLPAANSSLPPLVPLSTSQECSTITNETITTSVRVDCASTSNARNVDVVGPLQRPMRSTKRSREEIRIERERNNIAIRGSCVCCYPDYDCVEIVDLTIIPD